MIDNDERARREALIATLKPHNLDPEVYDRINNAYLEGQLNDFTYTQLCKNVAYFMGEEGMVDTAIQDMMAATAAGVKDSTGYGIYFMATQDVPDIIDQSLGKIPLEQKQNLVSRLFNKLLGMREQGETLPAGGLREMVLEEAGLPEKEAYPQGHDSGFLLPQYDLTKWMQATRGIYAEMQQKDKTFAEAEADVTGKWEKRERQDYKDWLKYYREETPKKYPKLAQKYYESPNTPGYFVPNFESLKADFPKPVSSPTDEQARVNIKREKDQESREMIEAQRSKIISRLNAAEKLLASLDGQMFAGNDQELMLKLLQELKRKVQTANKITVRSSLFEDLIHKEANRLDSGGLSNHAEFIRKIAQGAPPPDPLAMDPMMGGAPPAAPAAAAPISTEQAKTNAQNLFAELQVRMDTGGVVDPDVLAKVKKDRGIKEPIPAPPPPPPAPPAESPPPAEPMLGGDEGDKGDKGGKEDEEELPPSPSEKKAQFQPFIVVEAQPAAPGEAGAIGEAETDVPGRPAPPGPGLAPPAPAAPNAPVQSPAKPAPEEHTDDVIDAALKNLSVDDVIARLEMLTGLYKKREISRQLSILDIMMDRLGIGSYFPGLGEAMAKALESNQYISTRLEDALAKLKGSVENPNAAKMMESREVPPPQTKGIRDSLEADKQKEEERKEKRKEREMAKLETPPGTPPAPPAGEMGQAARELEGPAKVAPPRRPIGLR